MIQFTGTSRVSYGNVAGIDGATKFSISTWYQPVVFASAMGLFGKGSISPFRVIMYPSTGLIVFQVASTGQGQPASATFPVGELHHLGITYDGTQTGDANRLQLYKDGVAQALTFGNGGMTANLGAGSGANLTVGWEGFNGVNGTQQFGHLRMWNDWLSANQIKQEMNSYRPVQTVNLILWTIYDDGILCKDRIKNTETITGTPTSIQGPPVSYGG